MVIVTFGMELTVMYQLTDFFTGLFIIPNMVAVIWLVPQVVQLQKGKYYLADKEEKLAKKAAKHK